MSRSDLGLGAGVQWAGTHAAALSQARWDAGTQPTISGLPQGWGSQVVTSLSNDQRS